MSRSSWAWKRAHAALCLIAAGALASACDDEPAGPPELEAVTGITATPLSPGSIRVRWSAVPGATGYRVERAAGEAGAFAPVATTAATVHEDTGLEPETLYRYRVAALAGERQGPFGPEARAVTPARPVVVLNSDITTNRTLYADTIYRISGFIHVTRGATLTIQPGTRIEGDYDRPGSALFILRGARILAAGTADRPIVFTSSRPPGQRQPGDWGGLILVGNGIVNRASPVILEGTGTGPDNPAIDYGGGTDNEDSSGELRYVRIEFAGHATAPDQELNALTLAAVGRGTRIEYVQALSSLDDSFEFFGGAVDARYLVSYESGDDHFDMAEGYQGRLQFLIGFQSRVLQPRPGAGNVSSDPQGIENDGCAGANCLDGQHSQPYTLPLVANFTLVGTGPGVVDGTSGGIGLMLRRGTGGYYVNGAVARWPRAALSLRDQATQTRATAGELRLSNLLLAQVGAVFQPASGTTFQFQVDTTTAAIHTAAGTAAELFAGLPPNPGPDTPFDWRPAANSPLRTGGLARFDPALAARAGDFVVPTTYRGAAAPDGPRWWEGWTRYAVR